MYMNGTHISQYGAKLLWDYTVTGTELTSSIYKPRSGSGFTFLGTEQGMKTITLNFDIYGKDARDCALKKSVLDSTAAAGKVELFLPDGFLYTAVLQSAGEIQPLTQQIIQCQYIFTGIQHDKERVFAVAGYEPFWPEGTMPKMDCSLEATASAAGERYQLGEAIFLDVRQGDRLTFDGIDKRILINGAPGAQKCQWIHFPYLTPGENRIPCQDPVTVRYCPAYL